MGGRGGLGRSCPLLFRCQGRGVRRLRRGVCNGITFCDLLFACIIILNISLCAV